MLRLLGWLYGRIINIRNSLYDRGIFKSHSLGARTISIGNLTTGGTGKTPLVAYVAEILADAGEKVCVLTRGYGRKSSGRVLVSDGEKVLVDAVEGGDEPVELGRRLLGKAVIVADANRVSAAGWAKEKFGVTVFVLDDGFQHRRAKRNLDLVCIDGTVPFGNGDILPAGNLREPAPNLERADAIVLTRVELVQGLDSLVANVRDFNTKAPMFRAETRLRSIGTLDSFLNGSASDEKDVDDHTFAFHGLGNPGPFMTMLANRGTTLHKRFEDHHLYTQTDIQEIETSARLYGCNKLVTTAKDAVKLVGLTFELPCLVVETEIAIHDPDQFRDLVLSA